MIKGFTMDDERLKGYGGGKYWKEYLRELKILDHLKKYYIDKFLIFYKYINGK